MKPKSSNTQSATCTIRNHTFQHSMSSSQVRAYRKSFDEAMTMTDKRLLTLQQVLELGDYDTADTFIHQLLTIKKSRMAAVMRFAMRQPLALRPSLDQCAICAKQLDLTKPITEPARVHAQKKPGKDDWRPVADFGIKHRTAQHMIKALLERTFVPRPFQYGYKGVPEAVALIRAQADAGLHYFVHQDIANFFMHFHEGKLAMTSPLPTWAVEYAVTGRQMKWVIKNGAQKLMHQEMHQHLHSIHSPPLSKGALIHAARRGVPQGSSCSSIIGLIECSKLQVSKALEQRLTNFADDFLSLHPTQQDAESAAVELEEAASQLPGGNFTLKTKVMSHLSQGCEFLGHSFDLVDGKLRIRPSPANQIKLDETFAQLQDECGVFNSPNPEKEKVLQAAGDCVSYLTGWAAAFAECDDLDDRWVSPSTLDVQYMLDKVKATEADLVGIPATKKFSLHSWPTSAGM